MDQIDIVPIQFAGREPSPQHPQRAKIAARVKISDSEITIYNGMDKYILYTILKEMNANASRLNDNT